jgi:hypothetical protein
MIPLRITDLKLSTYWPRHIIIHHTSEHGMEKYGEFKFDTPVAQVVAYQKDLYKEKKRFESGYHFIVERIRDDYEVVVNQPLMTLCRWEDLDDKYHKDVHIALLGNYDNDIPTNRMYKVLAFRILAPLIRLFYMEEESILFHRVISNNKECTCPGEFIEMAKIKLALRSVLRRKPIARSTGR